jgi:hypothetical protein
MHISDVEIDSAAHYWIQRYGDDATAKAREMVEAMMPRGDENDADTWLWIIAAIGILSALRGVG